MTAIAILAIAFSKMKDRFDSFHEPNELQKYIDSVSPPKIPHSYEDHNKFFKVNTTKSGSIVTAAASVRLPNGEQRNFSYWLTKPEPRGELIKVNSRELEVFQGEYGLVGLYYGLTRPALQWPSAYFEDFNYYVHLMKEHIPGWNPPGPDNRVDLIDR